jgi:hypothetical protein
MLNMNIKRQKQDEKKYFLIFFIMMILHKSFYLFICICIYYTNAATPIEQTMEKLIQLISEEQVKKIFLRQINSFIFIFRY